MNVGDSFFAPFKKGSIRSYARIFAKQNNVTFRVVEMADENGVAGSRCWCIKQLLSHSTFHIPHSKLQIPLRSIR